MKLYPEVCNQETTIIDELHKGDDIAALTSSWLVSVLLNVHMRLSGQNGQDTKLIVGNGEFEFLRRLFCEDGIIRGYINRTIPNAVSTDL